MRLNVRSMLWGLLVLLCLMGPTLQHFRLQQQAVATTSNTVDHHLAASQVANTLRSKKQQIQVKDDRGEATPSQKRESNPANSTDTTIPSYIPVDWYEKARADIHKKVFLAADKVVNSLRQQVLRKRLDRRVLQERQKERGIWEPGRKPSELGGNSAPVRACFLTLVRHTKKEVQRLYRLLLNLREVLPLMAARYPIVVYHESAVTDEFMYNLLLQVADEHFKQKIHFQGTIDDSVPHGVGADIRDVRKHGANRFPLVNTSSAEYAKTFSDLQTSATSTSAKRNKKSRAQLAALVAQYIYPGGVELETLAPEDFGQMPSWVKSERGHHWGYPSTGYWGVSYRHMCRFYGARLFYTQSLQMRDFDYYMRLDVDSFILTTPMAAHYYPAVDEKGGVGGRILHKVVEEDGEQSAGTEGGGGNANNDEHGGHPATTAAELKVVEMDIFEEFFRRRHVSFPEMESKDARDVMELFRRIPVQGLRGGGRGTAAAAGENENDISAVKSVGAGDGEGAAAGHNQKGTISYQHSGLRSAHPQSARYGFVILHPQTQAIFLKDLWESYDEFLADENKGKWSVDGEKHGAGRVTIEPLRAGKSLFSTPRGTALHYWDNFEVMDIGMFRPLEQLTDEEANEATTQLLNEVRYEGGGGELNAGGDSSSSAKKKKKKYYIGGPLTAASLDYIALTPNLLKQIRRELTNHFIAQREESESADSEHNVVAFVQQKLAKTADFWHDFQIAYGRRNELAIEEHNSRQRGLHRFTDFFDKKGGFYYNRWGDAEVRTLMNSIFLEPSEILYVNSLPYQHYHNYHCPDDKLAATNLAMSVGWEDVHDLEKPDVVQEVLEKRQQALREKSSLLSKCAQSAARNFGQGSKGPGTAKMNPAERLFENGAFHNDATMQHGWTSI